MPNKTPLKIIIFVVLKLLQIDKTIPTNCFIRKIKTNEVSTLSWTIKIHLHLAPKKNLTANSFVDKMESFLSSLFYTNSLNLKITTIFLNQTYHDFIE